MPSELLSSLVSGGGAIANSFYSGTLQVASASSGNLVIITPPSGERVILNSLLFGSNETGITVNGSLTGDVISSLDYSSNTQGSGTFAIAPFVSTSSAINNAGVTGPLTFEINEVVTVIKDSGSTGSIMYYSYSYGG